MYCSPLDSLFPFSLSLLTAVVHFLSYLLTPPPAESHQGMNTRAQKSGTVRGGPSISCLLSGLGRGQGMEEKTQALSPMQQHVDTPQMATQRLAAGCAEGSWEGLNPQRLPREGAMKPTEGLRVNLRCWQKNTENPQHPAPQSPPTRRLSGASNRLLA